MEKLNRKKICVDHFDLLGAERSFQVWTEMENWCQPLWKMGKMAIAPILEQNFQLPTPLMFGSPVFRVSIEKENWCQPLWKMENSSPEMHPRAKLPITETPKVWISGFPSLDRNRKLVSAIMKNGENGCSSPKTCPRAKLPIIDPPKVWVSGFLSVVRKAKLPTSLNLCLWFSES